MKRIIALVLTLVSLVLLFPVGTAQAESVTKKDFYMINWSELWSEYDHVYAMPYFYSNADKIPTKEEMKEIREKGKPITSDLVSVYVPNYGTEAVTMTVIAEKMKEDFDKRPEGSRYFLYSVFSNMLSELPLDVLFMEDVVALSQAWLGDFLAYYKSIGGKLDGIVIDTEYIFRTWFYIDDRQYYRGNKLIYRQIVENPMYAEKLRPKLEARGFYFWPKSQQTEIKSEIWTIERWGGEKYAKDRSIWDDATNELFVEYMNAAILDPMLKHYPKAILSDYRCMDSLSWYKVPNLDGSVASIHGLKVGNASNINIYQGRPNGAFYNFDSSGYRNNYNAYPGMNAAYFAATPFMTALNEVNKFKVAYECTDTKLMNAWVSFYNYSSQTPTLCRTPYYAEALLHLGMFDATYIGYILPKDVERMGENDPDPDVGDYDYAIDVVEDIMCELSRVVGASDRKPIPVPYTWNGGYILTGMYAGGRNVWRITPDTTKVSVVDFKVKDTAPTFCVDGLTITFPQGRIIADGDVSMVGTCGYWIETPANVAPVITSTADRYENNPAFLDSFHYADGDFTKASVKPDTYWEISGTPQIQNGALLLSGNASVTNIKIPDKVTAGDYYAKQQAWEVTVTLPSGDYGSLQLLSAGNNDGIRISGGTVHYGNAGAFKAMAGVTLAAGTYTIKRELDFSGTAYKSNYSIYDASGNWVGGADGAITPITTPVSKITFSAANAKAAAAIDDYKLYAQGVTATLDVFEAAYGRIQENPNATFYENIGYRVSWMNATGAYKTAYVYNGTKLLQKVEMAPGMDGFAVGEVAASSGNPAKLTVKIEDSTAPTHPNYDAGDFSWTSVANSLGLAVGKPTQGIPGGTTGGTSDGTPGGTTGGVSDGTTGDISDGNTGALIPDGTEGGDHIVGPNGTQQPGSTTVPGEKKGLGVAGIVLIALLSLVLLCCGVVAAFWFVITPKLTEDSPPWLLAVSRRLDSLKKKAKKRMHKE